MTVKEGKAAIVEVLQDLRRDGITVRSIQIDWTADVSLEGKVVAAAEINCAITLEADL